MGDETIIVQGVNCPKTRWICRVICMLASVGWLTRLIVGLFWPSTWKDESGVVVLVFAAPFLYYAGMVVRSFCVPVPTPILNSGAFNWSGIVGFAMITMCFMTYFRNIDMSIYMFALLVGGLAEGLLSWPSKDVSIQHLVYTDFVLALVGYLGYQRPLWPAYLFVAALFLLNTFLFHGLLRLDFPDEEEEDHKSPV